METFTCVDRRTGEIRDKHSWKWHGHVRKVCIPPVDAALPQEPGALPWYARQDCHDPISYYCEFCNDRFVGVCNSQDSTQCAPCEGRWRVRVRTIARVPLLVAKKGSTLLVTLTAPGRQQHCLTHTYLDKKTGQRRPSVRCEGLANPDLFHSDCVPCLCGEVGHRLETRQDMRDWNHRIVRRFNDFITDLRRTLPQFRDVQYFRAIEPQKRGALHIHALLRLKRLAVLDDATMAVILKLTLRHGFGHEVDVKRIGSGDLDQVQAARYVAKYVSKAKTGETRFAWDYFKHCGADECSPTVMTVARRTHRRKLPRFWSCSRRWGLSYKAVMLTQSLFRLRGPQAADELRESCLAVVYEHQDDPIE